METMRYRSWIAPLAVLFFMVCSQGLAQAKMIDGIVAVVDNKVIMDSDLRKKMVELGAPMNDPTAQRQVLELMVEDIVIEKIYASIGLPPVSEKEAQRVAREIKVNAQTARSYIMKSALMEMMVRSRVVVTENMVKSYYDSHEEYQGRESVRLKQILVMSDESKLQKALDDLNAGGSFEETAVKYSDLLSSGSSDIGWIAVEDLSDEVSGYVRNAKPGDVIGPVVMANGSKAVYMFVEKKVIGKKTLDEVKDEITNILEKKYQQEAFNYWLHKMMTQYFIGIYI